MDIEREINLSIRRQTFAITRAAEEAQLRIERMHAVGTGVCGCGKDVGSHTWFDEHNPIEQFIDKGLVTAEMYMDLITRELLKHYRKNAFKNPRYRRKY